jgi:Domain of unknown function (DUF4277)
MEQARVERLDHFGVSAAVSKAFGLLDMINTRRVPDAQEVLTPGEAVAGMMLTGLGFAKRPLSLPPQVFASNPLARLLRAGIEAERFNRFQRGRTLDEASPSGGDLLLQELALSVCAQAGIALRFTHLDTTSCALSGEDVPERDAHAMPLTPGSSKDHRPALKQAVWALLGSQDGGVPCVSKSWEGNPSDIAVFQERAPALLSACKNAPRPRSLVAEATLSHEDKAPTLEQIGGITRLPHTRGLVSPVLTPALQWETWPLLRTKPALSVWSGAPLAWPSAGWWGSRRQPWSAPKRRCTKPRSAKRRPSKSHSFPCTPNAFPGPRGPTMP